MTDDFTDADAARMDTLFARRFDGTLTTAEDAELERLANAWQAAYTRSIPVPPPTPEGRPWTPPEPTEAMVRAALADAGQPADEEQVAMVMGAIRRGDGTR